MNENICPTCIYQEKCKTRVEYKAIYACLHYESIKLAEHQIEWPFERKEPIR